MLGLVLSFSTFSGCGNNTAIHTEVSTEAEESDTLYGEVSSVSDDSTTIEVGAYSFDDGTLTLSGEEKTITVRMIQPSAVREWVAHWEMAKHRRSHLRR